MGEKSTFVCVPPSEGGVAEEIVDCMNKPYTSGQKKLGFSRGAPAPADPTDMVFLRGSATPWDPPGRHFGIVHCFCCLFVLSELFLGIGR